MLRAASRRSCLTGRRSTAPKLPRGVRAISMVTRGLTSIERRTARSGRLPSDTLIHGAATGLVAGKGSCGSPAPVVMTGAGEPDRIVLDVIVEHKIDIMTKERLQELNREIFSEPITRLKRPALVEYIHLLTGRAKNLPKGQLLGEEGHGIAMDICGALAFQGAAGVHHDNWLNNNDEAILSELLAITGQLDIDAHNKMAWAKFFELVDLIDG